LFIQNSCSWANKNNDVREIKDYLDAAVSGDCALLPIGNAAVWRLAHIQAFVQSLRALTKAQQIGLFLLTSSDFCLILPPRKETAR